MFVLLCKLLSVNKMGIINRYYNYTLQVGEVRLFPVEVLKVNMTEGHSKCSAPD